MMAEVYEDITFRATALFHGESYCGRMYINGVTRGRSGGLGGAMNFRKRNFRRFPKTGEHLLKIPRVANVELLRLFQPWALLSKCQI